MSSKQLEFIAETLRAFGLAQLIGIGIKAAVDQQLDPGLAAGSLALFVGLAFSAVQILGLIEE